MVIPQQEDEGIRLLLIQLVHHAQDSPSVLDNKEITRLGYNGLKGEELTTTLAGRTCLLKITIVS